MRWLGYRLLATTLLTGQLALGGCSAADRPHVDGFRPDFTTLLQLPGSDTAVSRGQKPTGAPTRSLLDLGPDAPGSSDARSARIRATVNGDAILDEEVTAAAFQGLTSIRSEAEREELLKQKLNEIIERELLMQDAMARLNKKGGMRFIHELERAADREFEKQWLHRLMRANNITDTALFARMLRDQGIPLELIRRQWTRSFIAMEYLRIRIGPLLNRIGHTELVDYYDRNPDQFKVDDSLIWQDIFIANARHPSPAEARKFAEVLVGRIRQGEDFVRLAKSFDNGDSSLRENAEGIGRKRGEIKPAEAEAALFRLKDGEVGPLIEIETGYHIIRMVKRTYAGRQPFDEQTQKQITEKLKTQAFQKEMRKMVNDLKRHAIIEIASEIK